MRLQLRKHPSPTITDSIIHTVWFYATMVATNAGVILLFGTTRFLGAGARRTLVLVSALALAALGAYQLLASVLATTGP